MFSFLYGKIRLIFVFIGFEKVLFLVKNGKCYVLGKLFDMVL